MPPVDRPSRAPHCAAVAPSTAKAPYPTTPQAATSGAPAAELFQSSADQRQPVPPHEDLTDQHRAPPHTDAPKYTTAHVCSRTRKAMVFPRGIQASNTGLETPRLPLTGKKLESFDHQTNQVHRSRSNDATTQSSQDDEN